MLSSTALIFLITTAIIALVVIGAPILVGMGMWVVAVSSVIDLSLSNLGVSMFEGLNTFGLLAMPLFILTGDIINASGIAKKLTDFAYASMGWLRGGLAISSIGASGFFAAISGSNSATALTIGTIMYPELVRHNYAPGFAAATIASGGIVGVIIPPSILFILYAMLAGCSVNEMFIGGIIPGSMMILAMILVCNILSRRHNWGTVTRLNIREVGRTAVRAYLGFGAMALIMYGIYTGKFSPTEAAAVCVFFGLFSGLVITREVSLKALPELLFNSGKMVGMVSPLVGMSMAIQQCLASIGLDRWLLAHCADMGAVSLLVLTMVIMFFMGMFVECVPVITILAPILAPIAASVGIHPIHYGMVICMGSTLGYITPPFGLNIFVTQAVTDVGLAQQVPYLKWFIGALFLVWFLVAAFPFFTTLLIPG